MDRVACIVGMVCRGSDGKVVAGNEYEQAKMIFLKIKNVVESGSRIDAVGSKTQLV